MSLPIPNEPPPSSSPSKSSLRRKSGTGNTGSGPTTHFASETTQHHFLPHSPPNQTIEYEEEDEELEEQDASYDVDSSYQTAISPIPFQPFFTLIEDSVTSEHYHPTVHYIFSDDELDVITEAACRSLGQIGQSSTAIEEQREDRPRLPPPRSDVNEHYLILDVQQSNQAHQSQQTSDRLPSPSPSSVETAHALTKTYPYTVTSVQSLSADWQILRTNITDAPTMNSEQHFDEQHLMLRIEGRRNSPDEPLQRQDGETIENLIERYQTRLAEIRHLIADQGDEEEHFKQNSEPEVEGDIFTQAGLVETTYQPTGFGHAVLDEQD